MADDSKDPFTSDSQRDLVGSSKLTLGALIAIVLGGTALLFACLAFLWISLARRRAMRRDGLDINCGDTVIDECDTATTGGYPRKLRKSRSRPSEVTIVQEFAVPARKVSLASIFTRRTSQKTFTSLPSEHGSHRRKTSNQWIDEDAIHGPRVVRQSWRLSLSQSWPLKNLSPTLPRLHQFHNDEEELEEQHYVPMQPPPRPPPPAMPLPLQLTPQAQLRPETPEQQQQQQPQQQQYLVMSQIPYLPPPRQLPEPPVQAHLANQYQPVVYISPTSSPTRSPSYGDPQRQSPVNASPTRRSKRLRDSSTDSTLSEILKSTERRLQDGTTSGRISRRSRNSISPHKSIGPSRAVSVNKSASEGGRWNSLSRNDTIIRTDSDSPTKSTPSTVDESPIDPFQSNIVMSRTGTVLSRHNTNRRSPDRMTADDRLQVGNLVSELRRMNSQISSYSTATSAYSTASNESPALPTLGGGFTSHKKKKSGSKHYLSIGTPPRNSVASSKKEDEGVAMDECIEDAIPVIEIEEDSDSFIREEEEEEETSDVRPKLTINTDVYRTPTKQIITLKDIEDGSVVVASSLPRRMIEEKQDSAGRGSTGRRSEDSLGLYDKDGFLISSPERGSPVKKKRGSRGSRKGDDGQSPKPQRGSVISMMSV